MSSGSPLLPHDVHSAVWIKLNKFYEERLEFLRKKNDGDLDERGTIRLRAQISECKFFLALAEGLIPERSADDM